MKALSIRQPGAFCITHGPCRIEDRPWPTRFRGWFLIHTGKTYRTGMEHYIHAHSPSINIVEMQRSPRGGIVGIARLVDCIEIPLTIDRWERVGARIRPEQRVWTGTRCGPYAFLLEDVHPLPYLVPYPGRGFFFFF
jgi:hypothetical protein